MSDAPPELPGGDGGRVVRLRLDIAYDGTDFAGWASQPGLRTVQGELETWISRVLRLEEEVRLTCAGRTDSGVHARGQVAHLDLRPPEAAVTDSADDSPAAVELTATLERRLRRVLAPDLVVRAVTVAPPGFDARFSAVWRRYAYRIWDSDSRPDPLLRRLVTRVEEALDVESMNAGAASLLGLRDFAPFCKKREGATTIRELLEFRAVRLPDAAGTIEVTVRADAFCHNMVRSLVGALVAVGSGQRDLAWLTGIAGQSERAGQIHVLPPGGLTLEEVGYPADSELAARAAAARTTRTAE